MKAGRAGLCRLEDLAKGQSVGTFIAKAKQAARNSCWRSHTHTHTLQRQRQCQRQTERLEDAFNQRPPAAHPVRPSTSMINCRSMHFKNVNLSYMPRSIRLSPPKRKQTDRRAKGQMEKQTKRRSGKRKENL